MTQKHNLYQRLLQLDIQNQYDTIIANRKRNNLKLQLDIQNQYDTIRPLLFKLWPLLQLDIQNQYDTILCKETVSALTLQLDIQNQYDTIYSLTILLLLWLQLDIQNQYDTIHPNKWLKKQFIFRMHCLKNDLFKHEFWGILAFFLGVFYVVFLSKRFVFFT